MADLPVVSGAQAIRAFEKDGWVLARVKGSHHTLKKDGHVYVRNVPNHKELATGTLRKLINTSGLTVEQFCALL